MATILKTDGTCEQRQPANGTDFGLHEAQEIVDGYVEVVPLADGRIMLLNEEGKLRDLDVNKEATALYLDGRAGIDVIVGDVLVCENGEFR